jgi:hypothetical protein
MKENYPRDINLEILKKNLILRVLYHGTKSPKKSRKRFKKKLFLARYPGTKSPFLKT